MNIIFIAPPAAGKGTQSDNLEKKYGYKHIATGDLLRSETNKQTELGREIENIISKGELVSDKLITKLLKNELENIKHQKFILDGYPRNIEQAEQLSELLQAININNYIVIYLDVSLDIAQKRALGRLVCPQCETNYNKYFQNLMPKENGICDKCHNELVQRTDDNEETFKKRFDTYLNVTNPLLDYYKKINKLHVINANLSAEEIFKNIEGILVSQGVDN